MLSIKSYNLAQMNLIQKGSTLQTSVSPIAGVKGYKHFLRKESHLPMTFLQQKKLMLTC